MVAIVFNEKAGIDYEEVFSPVACLETIRMIIYLVAHNKWLFYQVDMKLAFHNRVLDEEVYVEQPIGYNKEGDKSYVLNLKKKTLYSLKQVLRAWKYFQANNFSRCSYEHAFYSKVNEDGEFFYCILICGWPSLYRNYLCILKEFRNTIIQG